jgi:hypothetical protein
VNPQDPLAALHPLREPAAVGWWPPAPLWWLLALGLSLLVALLGYRVWRRRRDAAYRRRALRRLDELHREWLDRPDDVRYVQDVNALLKATALHCYPPQSVAGLSGERWRLFLERSTGGDGASAAALTDNLYCPRPPVDGEAVYRFGRHWLHRHRGPAC